MQISLLLRQLASHGIELRPEGSSLPAPQWPRDCPQELRQCFNRGRRAIMARIASPVFVYFATVEQNEGSANASQRTSNESAEFDLCLAIVDDETIIWMPAMAEDSADSVIRRLGLQRMGIEPSAVQVVTGHAVPPIIRRAIRSGRIFCSWDTRASDLVVWRKMGFTTPLRWIDLCELARAGGWPGNLDDLQWSLLRVRTGESTRQPNQVRSDDVPNRIHIGLKQLLGMADVYDYLKPYDEPDVIDTHHEINSHGIGLDIELAHRVLILAEQYAETQFSYILDATAGTMTVAQLLNDDYVLAWLQSWGVQFPNLDAATIEWSRDHILSVGLQHPRPVDAVLRARLDLARQPIGSLRQALELVDNGGRVSNHMDYFVSSAGEFASRGINFGALISTARHSPEHWRGISAEFPSLDDIVSYLTPAQSVVDVLGCMVADCFIPSPSHVLRTCSWPGLMAQVATWLVGACPRIQCDGLTFSIDLARRELVQQVRYALKNSQRTRVCRCEIAVLDGAIEVCLPSGRSIYYRNEDVRHYDVAKIINEVPVTAQCTILSKRGVPSEDVVADDILRGVARDVVVNGLLCCKDANVHVVAHGCDFLVMEVSHRANWEIIDALLDRISGPEWAHEALGNISVVSTWRLGGGANWKPVKMDGGIGVPF